MRMRIQVSWLGSTETTITMERQDTTAIKQPGLEPFSRGLPIALRSARPIRGIERRDRPLPHARCRLWPLPGCTVGCARATAWPGAFLLPDVPPFILCPFVRAPYADPCCVPGAFSRVRRRFSPDLRDRVHSGLHRGRAHLVILIFLHGMRCCLSLAAPFLARVPSHECLPASLTNASFKP